MVLLLASPLVVTACDARVVSVDHAPRAAGALAEAIEGFALVTAMGLTLALAIVHALLFALDRRRREHAFFAWFAAASMMFPLYVSGWLTSRFGPAGGAAFGVAHAAAPVIGLALTRASYDAGRPSRAFWALPGLVAVAWVTVARAWSPTTFAWVVALASTPPALAHARLLVRLSRTRAPHARLVLSVWTIATAATAIFDGEAFFGRGLVRFSGVHVGLFSVSALMLLYAYLLAARHVASSRAVEQLADELRAQVAAKSEELSRALDRRLTVTTEAELEVGALLDARYRVIAPVGRGGMGEVWRAERLRDGRVVAVKVIRGEASALSVARLAREARLACAIRHPNVVRVLDVSVARDGFLYLVMEHLEGEPLSASRLRYGDVAWALGAIRGVASALAALHARGIVHRDLKPSNVVLVIEGERQTPKLIDFGLALLQAPSRASGQQDETTRSMPSNGTGVAGTPRFMAPEVLSGRAPASPASDVFALAVMAHLVLSGRMPESAPLAEGDGALALPGVPAQIARWVARGLSVEPGDRPLVGELLSALPCAREERTA